MRWAALAVVMAIAAPALADGDKARADKLFADGRTYLQNKEFQLACTAFEESEKADPAIGTALNIALCYEQWGHLAAAYTAYQEAERYAKLRFDDRAKVAHDKLAELDPKVPHVMIQLPEGVDQSTVYLFDGKEIERVALMGDRRVEIGDHTVEARVPGKPPMTTRVTVVSGDRKTVTVQVPTVEVAVVATRGPRKTGRLFSGLAAGVVGAAGIAIGSVVALHARNDYDAAVKTCPMLACDTRDATDKANHARSRANEMTFVIAGGGVLLAAGAYLILTSGGDMQETGHVALRPVIGAGGVGLTIGGGW